MRVLCLVSFLLIGAAYGIPTTQPACLTVDSNDPCLFPFSYKGVTYDKCTYVETINNQPWCATVPEVNVTREGKVLFKNQIGDCDLESNCQVEDDYDYGNDDCLGKPCGEGCLLGVCDGYGFCVNAEENPCEQHGCEGKSCGEDCLLGDIVGTCDVDGNCDFDFGKAISTCDGQGLLDECSNRTCGEPCQAGVCDGYGFCVNAEENPCEQHGCEGKSCGEECLTGDIVGTCDVDGNCDFDFGKAISSCDGQGLLDECSNRTCGELCQTGVCDSHGFCVNAEENPCLEHGCGGKSCGDECLAGDVIGYCDVGGNCDFDSGRAIDSCSEQDECLGKPCGEVCGLGVCDGFGFCVYAEENPCLEHGCSGKSCGEDCLSGDIVGTCDIDGNCEVNTEIALDSCSSQGVFGECSGKPCGESCESVTLCDGCGGVCDGYGLCVNAEENPCEQHGCEGKSCGEECLQGDVVGVCDIYGECNFIIGEAIDSCNNK